MADLFETIHPMVLFAITAISFIISQVKFQRNIGKKEGELKVSVENLKNRLNRVSDGLDKLTDNNHDLSTKVAELQAKEQAHLNEILKDSLKN